MRGSKKVTNARPNDHRGGERVSEVNLKSRRVLAPVEEKKRFSCFGIRDHWGFS